MRNIQSLNGVWEYRIGKGEFSSRNVPFSCLAVGHSECKRSFDLEYTSKKVFLKFDGITYYARAILNGKFIGEMLPYSEYSFDITDVVKEKDNLLLVEIEDTEPKFGPTDGWENFGGIIRNVSLLYLNDNYIEDVVFKTKLVNDYNDAEFTVDAVANKGETFNIKLYFDDAIVCEYSQSQNENFKSVMVEDVKLWSPETPDLYRLEVELVDNGEVLDVYSCKVGFREFTCDRHRFILNGKPIFIKGVCKHEMFGDSGHCPTEEQMLYDLRTIKETGCNFVRLVHYPHNKRVLEIADEIGLMVSEEPGLWWSDTSDPEVENGSLEVLKRTILRDRNHACVVFWLCFNECRFTEQFLIKSANVCREYDTTRLVSGANCMNDEDTLIYYNKCGFDFYTMHPYSETMERAKTCAKALHDKPLIFTEWGGYYVYNNPMLLEKFIRDMYKLYLANSDDGALAGACFWEWSELNDFNRGAPACVDGNLSEGLVDKYRKPTLIYETFKNTLKTIDKVDEYPFWIEFEGESTVGENLIKGRGNAETLNDVLARVHKAENAVRKMRRRRLKMGPRLENADNLNCFPLILEGNQCFSFDCNVNTDTLTLFGMVSMIKGYPLEGEYGEAVAEIIVTYDDGEVLKKTFENGVDITTVFELLGSSKINPVAQNAERFATFGYNKNFERYIMNKARIAVDGSKTIKNITLNSANNGYSLLMYAIAK